MKKALAYALSLALLLSLSACHKPQQPDNSQPDNSAATSTEPDVSTPEPEDNIPEPAPQKAPALEQLSDTTPAVPAENEDPQGQGEPAAQEPAETEPVKTETPEQTAPKADNSPAETKPEQQPAEQPQQSEEKNALEEALERGRQKAEENRQQQAPSSSSGGGMTLEEAQAQGSGVWVDEYGQFHIPGAREEVKLG